MRMQKKIWVFLGFWDSSTRWNSRDNEIQRDEECLKREKDSEKKKDVCFMKKWQKKKQKAVYPSSSSSLPSLYNFSYLKICLKIKCVLNLIVYSQTKKSSILLETSKIPWMVGPTWLLVNLTVYIN